MNFGDKLINLRKRKGMSQEELGEKLGVTRQTVSKWELGQTTPEMDKLRDISILFDVSVNYLMNDNFGDTEEKNVNKVEEQNVMSENNDEKRKKILIIAVIVIGVLLVGYIISGIVAGKILNFAVDKVDDTYNKETQMVEDIFNQGTQMFEDIFNQGQEMINDSSNPEFKEDDIQNMTDKVVDVLDGAISVFDNNAVLEAYKGTNDGSFAKKVIDEIVDNNNKNKDYQIKLEINGVEYQETDDMVDAKKNLDDVATYEIMYKYNDAGYISQAIIK